MKKTGEESSVFSDFNFTGLIEDEPQFEVKKEEEDIDDGGEHDDIDEEDVEQDDEVDDADASEDGGDENKTPSDESKHSSSSFKVLAKVLSEEGVLSSFKEDKKVESAQDLIDIIQEEINSRVELYKNSLPEDVRELVDNHEEGVNVSDLKTIQNEIKSFESVKVEDLTEDSDLMKKIISRDLQDLGMSQEDIDEEITDIFSLGKEDIRAKKSLERIKSRLKERKQALIDESKEREKLVAKEYNERITKTKKAIDDMSTFANVELTKKVKDEIFDSMTKPVGEYNGTPINAIVKKRLEDPDAFDRNMATVFVLTKGFSDFSKLASSFKRTAIKELEQEADKLSASLSSGVKAPYNQNRSGGRGTVLHDIDIKHIV